MYSQHKIVVITIYIHVYIELHFIPDSLFNPKELAFWYRPDYLVENLISNLISCK